jgi:hypothetical protein
VRSRNREAAELSNKGFDAATVEWPLIAPRQVIEFNE